MTETQKLQQYTQMDAFEFELRYRAYAGLAERLKVDWSEALIMDAVKISPNGVPDRKIQEISPDELREITLQTYTKAKQKLIADGEKVQIEEFTLGDYIHRLEYELKVIKEMGFNTYFLIVQDFCIWAKENDVIVGPGRGSGAGSLLAWVTQITDLDPLIYGLLFERFLNPARISMPDFDIDFEDTQRDKVIEYVKNKYGADKVCAIGTYMQLATKAAFKDAARTLGVNFERSNHISNLFPDRVKLHEMMEHEDTPDELKNLYENDRVVREAVDVGTKLEGNMRQLGVHACGIIIAPEPVQTYTAVQRIDEDSDMYVSQYEGKIMEKIGLLKMDFLGLRNLSVIRNCIKIIMAKAETAGEDIPEMFTHFTKTSSFQPPIDDMYTYEKVFQTGDTTGIFQFESDGMKRFLIQLKASGINDLIAMASLYRPGPMEFIPTYIARKHGEEKLDYMLPELREELMKVYDDEAVVEEERKKLIEDLGPIMDVTYGIAVYQEQLMFLVQRMAGFSLPEADLLRRGIGKKIKEVIEQLKVEFIQKAQNLKGYKPETGRIIYERMIEPAASYSFNKSHAACYAWIAYQTGYLKAHYPVEFYAALIRSVEEDTDKVSFFVKEVQQHGLKIEAPDVNTSFNHVAAIDDTVKLGFLSIKGVGNDVGEFLQSEREKNGSFKDLEDFLTRCTSVLNKRTLEALTKSGALDAFGDRLTLVDNVKTMLDWATSSQDSGGGLFGAELVEGSLQLKPSPRPRTDAMLYDYEMYKTFVSLHPFDGLYAHAKRYSFISQFANEEGFGAVDALVVVTNIQRARKAGFFVQVEDISGDIEFFMRDVMDIKKFDLLNLKGYKGRSLRVSKILRLSLDDIITTAQKNKRYKEWETVVAVRLARGEQTISVPPAPVSKPVSDMPPEDLGLNEVASLNNQESIQPEKLETIATPVVEKAPEEVAPQTVFDLPEDMKTLHAIVPIVKGFSGDIDVTIWPKTVQLNQEGLTKLTELLS